MSKVKVEESSPITVEQEMQDNADNTDIYSDVLTSQDARFEKLLQEVEKLRNEKLLLLKSLNSMQKSYEKLRKEFEDLEIKNKTLAYNASALFKTAQAEIVRKDRTIQGLRKEKDDLLFRRSASIRALRRSRRSVTVSPRKIRSPLKTRLSSDHHSLPIYEDSAGLHLIKGNDINIISELKENAELIPPESINEVKHVEEKAKDRGLPGQEKEEKLQSSQDKTYMPPPIQGPITMYSKRLYKKIYGVSPQKVALPTETLGSTVKDLPNYLVTRSLPSAVNKQLPTETVVQVHETSSQVKLSPIHSLESNIITAKDHHINSKGASLTDKNLLIESADQVFVQPIDCKTSSLASKLRLNTQEFIKLGSSVKCLKTPSQEVIIDLRKLPKENYSSSDNLVKEILSSALKSSIGTVHTSSCTFTTKKETEIVDMGMNEVIDLNTMPTKTMRLGKKEVITPVVEIPAPINEMNRSLDVNHTTSHDTQKLNNRNRARGNMSLNKPFIAPVTFGKLVPHYPPKVIAKPSVCQSISLVKDQTVASGKRKYDTTSPTESILPANIESPLLSVVGRVKRKKILELFGESPIKSDKPDVSILNRKSPSPTLIFPDSPSLDSDNSEDLVIDTTACSINSSPRLSESEKNDGIESVKTKAPSQESLEVNTNSKMSSKSIDSSLKNVVNETDPIEKKVLKSQKAQNFTDTLPKYELPDLSDCFSLDNDVRTIKKPSLNSECENGKLVVIPPQQFTDFVQPESKSLHLHVVNVTKEEISTPRFVPSPPQQSGLTHPENSLLNIAVDTMDFISTLALTKGGDISPLRTPDKRHNVLTAEMHSPKADQSLDDIDHKSAATNTIHLESIDKITQNDYDKGTEAVNNSVSNDLSSHITATLNIDCLVEKQDLSKTIDDQKPQAGDSSKYSPPQSEFKRSRRVRRLDSIPKLKEKISIPNPNKENVQSKPGMSNLLICDSINRVKVDLSTQEPVLTPEKCQYLSSQSIGDNTRNRKIDFPNSTVISKDKEHLSLAPFPDSLMGETKQTISDVTLKKKKIIIPHQAKEMQYSKSDGHKLNRDGMLLTVISKSNEQHHLLPTDKRSTKISKTISDVISEQNEQYPITCLKANTNISQMEKSSLVSISKEQSDLTLYNSISNDRKSFNLVKKLPDKETFNLQEINVAAGVSKSTSATIPPKLVLKTQKENDLTEYLVKLINKDKNPALDVSPKPTRELNANVQEISPKNKMKIASCEPIDLSMVKSNKTLPSTSGDNLLHNHKHAGKKLLVRKATVNLDKTMFKRSMSIKMAKPIPKVVYYQLNKNLTTTDMCNISSDILGGAQKHVVNTDKELEEMPHVARINQKVRVSSYHGNKTQYSKGLGDSPPVMKKNEINLDQLAEFKLPESSFEVKKNIVAVNGSSDNFTGNSRRIYRRSVSVDRVFSVKKSTSLTGKQPRNKSNVRGNFASNKTTPEISDKKGQIEISRPLKRNQLQQHSRRSQSESPGRKTSSNHYSIQMADKTSIRRNDSELKNNSHFHKNINNLSNYEPNRSSPISPERTSRIKLKPIGRSRNFGSITSTKYSRRSVSADRVLSKKNRQRPTGQQLRKSFPHHNNDSIGPLSENYVKRTQSRSPSPIKNVKFEQYSRASQSMSPDQKIISKRSADGHIQTPRSFSPIKKVKFKQNSRRSQSVSPDRSLISKRNSDCDIQTRINISQSKNNSRNQETQNTPSHELNSSSSTSPDRAPGSKCNNVHRSKESNSPEPRISRRSYHQSRRVRRNSLTEEYSNRSRKRSRTPPQRSHSQHYRDRSSSPEHRHHRYVNPRNRSRNQYENFRSRSPPRSHCKRSTLYHSPDEHELFKSSGSYRTHKKQAYQSEKYSKSTIDAELANKLLCNVSGVSTEDFKAILKTVQIFNKISQNEDWNLEKENANTTGLADINNKDDVYSQSQSLYGSEAKISSKTSNLPDLKETSSSKSNHMNFIPTSNVHSQNYYMDNNRQQMVNTKENVSFTKQKKENLTIPNNDVSTTSTNEPTSHKPVKRIKIRTRNLGDSDVNVVSATKVNERI